MKATTTFTSKCHSTFSALPGKTGLSSALFHQRSELQIKDNCLEIQFHDVNLFGGISFILDEETRGILIKQVYILLRYALLDLHVICGMIHITCHHRNSINILSTNSFSVTFEKLHIS